MERRRGIGFEIGKELTRCGVALGVPVHAIHGSFLEIITTEMYG
jgi:hypothetical protein